MITSYISSEPYQISVGSDPTGPVPPRRTSKLSSYERRFESICNQNEQQQSSFWGWILCMYVCTYTQMSHTYIHIFYLSHNLKFSMYIQYYQVGISRKHRKTNTSSDTTQCCGSHHCISRVSLKLETMHWNPRTIGSDDARFFFSSS